MLELESISITGGRLGDVSGRSVLVKFTNGLTIATDEGDVLDYEAFDAAICFSLKRHVHRPPNVRWSDHVVSVFEKSNPKLFAEEKHG